MSYKKLDLLMRMQNNDNIPLYLRCIITIIGMSVLIYTIYSIYALYSLASTTGITTADWIWYGVAIFLGFAWFGRKFK